MWFALPARMKPSRKRLALMASIPLVLGLLWIFLKPGAKAFPSSEANAPGVDGAPLTLQDALQSNVEPPRTPEGDATLKALVVTLNSETDPDEQNDLLEHALDSIPEQKVRSTLDALKGQEGEMANLLRRALIRRWAEVDPRAACQWVAQLSGDPAYRDAMEQVAIAWAGVDPQAATGWAACLADSPLKTELLLQMAYEVAGSQPTTALRIASTLPSGTDRDNLVVHAVSQWASSDAQAANTWLEGIPEGTLRERLVAALACSLAVKDGAAAGELVSSNLSSGVEQDRAVIEVVQRWAQSSPSSAGSWITAFPDVPLRQTALQTLLTIWSMQDHAGAVSWVGNLPQGPLRQAGLIALAEATPVFAK